MGTGLAYLLGVVAVNSFASELGIPASDLGVDIRDYAVLALVPLVPLGLGLLGFLSAYQFFVRLDYGNRIVQYVAAISLVVVVGAIYFLTLDSLFKGLDAFASGPLAILSGLCLGILEAVSGRPLFHVRYKKLGGQVFIYRIPYWVFRWVQRVLFGTVVVAVVLATMVQVSAAPRDWANELQHWATHPNESSPQGPYGLETILEPSFVAITVDGSRECALRIGGNTTISGSGNTIVYSRVSSFEVGSCTP
jgi:hypothetical protein